MRKTYQCDQKFLYNKAMKLGKHADFEIKFQTSDISPHLLHNFLMLKVTTFGSVKSSILNHSHAQLFQKVLQIPITPKIELRHLLIRRTKANMILSQAKSLPSKLLRLPCC